MSVAAGSSLNHAGCLTGMLHLLLPNGQHKIWQSKMFTLVSCLNQMQCTHCISQFTRGRQCNRIWNRIPIQLLHNVNGILRSLFTRNVENLYAQQLTVNNDPWPWLWPKTWLTLQWCRGRIQQHMKVWHPGVPSRRRGLAYIRISEKR